METRYIIMITGMVVVTYLPRYLPLAILSRMQIPEVVVSWLKYIPPAILAALLAPGILMVNDKLVLTSDNIYLLAAFPTLGIAIWKKNIFLTVLVGMLTVIGLEYIL